MFLRIFLYCIVSCLYFLALANASPITFSSEKQMRAEQGLPSDTVFSIVQDELGFVWVGTPAGIGVLNGHEPSLYHGVGITDVARYSPGNLYRDQNNTIWVGTWGHGVYRIQPDRTSILPYNPDLKVLNTTLGQQKVQSLFVDASGGVWIGTFDKGVIHITSNQVITHYHQDADGQRRLQDNRIWKVAEDPSGAIWVATSNGLARLAPEQGDTQYFFDDAGLSVADRLIRDLQVIGDYLWIGTNLGLFRIHISDYTIEKVTSTEVDSFAVNRIISDRNTGLWVATFNGLLHYDLMQGAFSTFADGGYIYKVSQDIRDIHVTPDNLLILATRTSGVFTLNPTPLTFSSVSSLSAINDNKNHIFSIATDANFETWAGTNNGLIKYDLRTGERIPLPEQLSGFNEGRITATIAAKRGNEIWFGTSDNLYSYNIHSQQLQSHRDKLSQQSINHVQRLLEDSRGNIWVTVSHQGIFRISQDFSVQHYHQQASGYYRVPSNNTVQLIETQNGEILLLVDNLTLLRKEPNSPVFEPVTIRLEYQKAEADLIATTMGSNGQQIWIGTYSGLLFLPSYDAPAQLLSVENGLSSNDIRAVIADNLGQIWVSTANGITLLSQEAQVKRVFTEKDGLSANALNLRSAFACLANKICFGSESGINVVNSDKIIEDFDSGRVAVTNIWVNNILQAEPAIGVNALAIELDNTQRNLRFQFTSIDHDPNADAVLYYKLHGFDQSWQLANISRIANYTNLAPGEYVFQVTTRPQNSLAVGTTANINISIIPPFWLRPMTQFVAVVSAVILLIFFYRLRISQIKKNEKKLNKLVSIRTENMAVLGSIGMEITRATSFDEIFERLKHHLKSVLYGHKFMLGMVDDQNNQLNFDLVIHEAVKLQNFSVSLSEVTHPAVWSYLHQKEVMVDRASGSGHFIRHLEEQDCAFVACLPLKVDQTRIGVIYVQSFRDESFGEYERQFLRTIAAYTAIAIKNAQFYKHEKELQLKRISWLENITHYLNHEMKNAILGAQTSLSMMSRKTDDPAMRKYIERATRSHDEMSSIMKAVSNTTSLEAAIMQAELSAINQSQVVEQRLNEYRHIYKDVNIIGEVESDIGIIGNEDLIVQLLDKLVNNAIEHHAKGTPIMVKLMTVKSRSVLSVKNIGDALPEDTDFIFGLFTSTKTNARAGNFGMGLYIARLIAEFHKGKVIAEAISDTEKQGAVFSFSLPMHPLAEQLSARRSA